MVGGALQFGYCRFPPLTQQQVPDKDVTNRGHAEQKQECREQDEKQGPMPKTCGAKGRCNFFLADDVTDLFRTARSIVFASLSDLSKR
ncbi:MAG: hypothetical protein ACD_75C02644G0002 [uncultured bacterium]|nr:MAG: hypothetical protein ACD_75C02644G0002 [uncultured bacterium]HBG19913.1 hypothetical protein [Desulfobulbaceae bacterium]